MIVSLLQGGLGNQLFQWAVGSSLARQSNTEFAFDLRWYHNAHLLHKSITKRNFELNYFPNLKYSKLNIDNTAYQINELSDYKYQKIDIDKTKNYLLVGYWQSYKYFQIYSNEIKAQLYIDIPIKIKPNSVSIHIRRTDYLNNNHHTVQLIDYYKRALSIIKEYSDILIFSDDMGWCKKNLNFNNMKFIETNNNILDLYIMSMCDNNIIANSSFSWWGAWLNKNPNKIVIAPSQWTEQHKTEDIDLIPENWIIT